MTAAAKLARPPVLGFDLVEDLADRRPLSEMAQFDRQVLLQRLVALRYRGMKML